LCSFEGANIIKIHRRSGKISFLLYPDFNTYPHPALQRSVRLSLRTRQFDCYGQSSNPLTDHSGISARDEWARRLSEWGFALKGHRLVRLNKQATQEKLEA
jgi:hypothetical protein